MATLNTFGQLLVAGVALWILYLYLLPKPIPGIPYNKKAIRSPLGDIPSLLRRTTTVNGWMLQQARRHSSPICQLFIRPWGKPTVFLFDFHEAQDIMMRRKEFDRGDHSINLLSTQAPLHHINLKMGPVWKAHRRLLQDLMLPTFLHDVAAPNIYQSTISLIKLWHSKASRANGHPFSVEQDVYYMALDAVLDFSFADAFAHRALPSQIKSVQRCSGKVLSHEDETVDFGDFPLDDTLKAFLRPSEAIGDLIATPFPGLSWKWMKMKSSEKNMIRTRYTTIENQITMAVKRLELPGKDASRPKSAIDMMMSREQQIAAKDGREPHFWSPSVKDEVIGFIVAGHDTTSTTLLWALKFITDSPSTREALRDALQSAHSDASSEQRMPSIQEIINTNIPYLDATMEEALRRASTIALLSRQCDRDTVVLGKHIPKGTTVFLFNRGPSYTEPSYDIDELLRSSSSREAAARPEWDPKDMSQFRPERWLDRDGNYDASSGPSLPFGLGARGCYGRRMAYLELRIVLTLVMWNFDLLPCPDHLSGYDAVSHLTYKPKQCYLRLKPRPRYTRGQTFKTETCN